MSDGGPGVSAAEAGGTGMSEQEPVQITLTREVAKWLRDTCDDHLAAIDARRGTDREEEWDAEGREPCIAVIREIDSMTAIAAQLKAQGEGE